MRSDIIRVCIHFSPGHHCYKTGSFQRHVTVDTIVLDQVGIITILIEAMFNLIMAVFTALGKGFNSIPFLYMYIMAGITGHVLAQPETFARHH